MLSRILFDASLRDEASDLKVANISAVPTGYVAVMATEREKDVC